MNYTEHSSLDVKVNAADCINDAVKWLAHICEIDDVEVWSHICVDDCANCDESDFKQRYREIRSEFIIAHQLKQLRLL